MRYFEKVYARVLGWTRHEHALRYLCVLSFAEAFIFPVIPEVMLAPMMLGKRQRAFFYAHISLLCSLLGSVVGYALGHWAFQALSGPLEALHLLPVIELHVTHLRAEMHQHAQRLLLVLFFMALQPLLPMKLVTWAAGIVGVPLLPFLMCVALGRGKRVWLLALLVRKWGERAERIAHKYIEPIGWGSLTMLLGLILWWYFR